jgi:hypothetical protein
VNAEAFTGLAALMDRLRTIRDVGEEAEALA